MHRRRACARQRWLVGGVVLLSLAFVGAVQAENWPRFRGPNGQGIAEAGAFPAKWSERDYNWKIDLPGGGHSSPVVWGDKIFVTCADDTTLRGYLLCLNAADGRELWRKEYSLIRLSMNALNSYAAASPALDADQVYLFWPDKEQPTLAALTHEGREVWTAKLPGIFARHGAGSSPIVHGTHVIISREQDKSGSGPASVWLALDRRTGQVQWRYEHPQNANGSYSTPCVWRDPQGREQLIFASNSHGIAGVNPETGALLWQTPKVLPARVVSSPVLAGDMVIATCGEGGRGLRLAAVKPPESSSSAATEVYGLDTRIVPYVPISIVRDGLLFAFHDQGTVSCLRVATGEVVWSEKPAGRYFGSPIWADGKLYSITVDGEVVVLRAGPKYELLAVNPLGEKSQATPAVAGGRMYLRTYSHLSAIGVKRE
jgi:outer membrane protein assembly factor BamB